MSTDKPIPTYTSEPHFVSEPPARPELQVEKRGPEGPKIGFMVYERPFDDCGATPDYDAKALEATDYADSYRSGSRIPYSEPPCYGWTCLDVLPNLVGRPWDQFALNMLRSVRPSGIRVVGYSQCMTADSAPWRVTVRLDKDNRTISKVEQEVEVGTVGAQHGHGLYKYEHGQDPTPQTCFVNTRGLKKLKLDPEGPGR